MANSFKSDDSFLRKLAVGAAGTNATIQRLQTLGFQPIELERGSRGFKIWKKIKIKRVRVPDILCQATGLRFESRGKTKPEISMSHSLKDPNRAWDSGMRDDDWVTIVLIESSPDSPIETKEISPVHFIRVQDLRAAFTANQFSITKPKGVEEGSEIRVIWTCAVANQVSKVETVDAERITLAPINGSRRHTIKLLRSNGKIRLLPQVRVGQSVTANQIVAAVVPIITEIKVPKTASEAQFAKKLTSFNLSERYSAAKALRYRGYSHSTRSVLEKRMTDEAEDIYVQLEAAAALAAGNHESGWRFLETKLRSGVLSVPLETQLESIIVASEIPNGRSESLLVEVLRDPNRDEELRAGVAWALGQFSSTTSANALVDTFNQKPIEVKSEAARALLRIAEPLVSHLIELLKTGNSRNRDGLAWVLARIGKFNPGELVNGSDEDLRRWISYIVGYGKERFDDNEVQAICHADREVYFAASVLWQILASWVHELREY